MNELPEDSVFLIPVLLAECEPPAITVGHVSFRDVQWYDMYNRGIGDLVRYIRMIAELRTHKMLGLGSRLVIDFGTSNAVVADATTATPERILAIDVGAGTADISSFPVTFDSVGGAGSSSDQQPEAAEGDAAHLYRLAKSDPQLKIVRYLHGVDDDWISLTALAAHGGISRGDAEHFLDDLCRAKLAKSRSAVHGDEYRLLYGVIKDADA
jgi:hypothetical protein